VKVAFILTILTESGIFSVLPAPLRDLNYVPTAAIRLKLPKSETIVTDIGKSPLLALYAKGHSAHTKSDSKSMRVMPLCLWGV
jgi:hypothetical protein